jgi:Site-specific recombinases, DNA invertase Pin homologs
MKSVRQQHEQNQRSCERHGITLLEPYVEQEAVSASRYARKKRDAFELLLDDLQAGKFGAHVLVLWENSRGSREVKEWAILLDLLEEHEILVHVTTHGRTYDPANPRDRRLLLDDANDAEYESAKTSMRIRRDMQDNAAQGRPHGVCPYGLRPLHDRHTGRLITWERDPDKAPVIEELFTRLRQGHSFKAITKDFAQRGITNRKGRPFTHQHLRDMATRAAYAGYRVYHGELIEAIWEPIVPRELWWDVQRILKEPAHQNKAPRPGRVLHEYTGIIKCDVCSGPIGVVRNRGREEYKCQDGGCIRIEKPAVDEVVTRVILAYLSREDVYQGLNSRSDSEAIAAVRDELARLRAELAEAEHQTPTTVEEARMFARLVAELRQRVADAENRHRQLTTPSELTYLVEPGIDVAKRWHDAPVTARRKAAALLLTPELLGEVRITRSPVRNHRVPVEQRMIWHRQEDTEAA